MNINLLKNLPVALACFSSAVAFAGMDMDSRVSQLEAQMKQVRTAAENNNFGAKTAEAGPNLVNPVGLFLNIGAIYQTAILGGTEYAYSDDNTTNPTAPINGSLREVNGSWSWGVNAMVGYKTGHDGWDVRAVNSYYNCNDSSSMSKGAGGTVIPVRVALQFTDTEYNYVDEAKSNLDITYDLLGLELGRDFYVSQYLSLRPNYGLLASWVWTAQKTAYTGGDIGSTDSYYVRDLTNWFGIGPEFGIDTTWALGKGLSLFANGKGALMYGRFKNTHTEDYSATQTYPYDIDLSNSDHRIVPYLQAMLGLQYDFKTEDNKHAFLVRAGWNTQFFFSQNQSITPDYTSANDSYVTFTKINQNLQVQGLILDATWFF